MNNNPNNFICPIHFYTSHLVRKVASLQNVFVKDKLFEHVLCTASKNSDAGRCRSSKVLGAAQRVKVEKILNLGSNMGVPSQTPQNPPNYDRRHIGKAQELTSLKRT